MTLFALLLYGVPLVCIVTTLYVGYLGFRFYLAEVVRDGARPPRGGRRNSSAWSGR